MAYRVIASSRSRFGLGFEEAGATIALLSFLALAGALAIEHIGSIEPCPLCLDQRIAYYAAVPLGLLAFALARGRPQSARAILGVLAIGFAVNAGVGVYHSGVEWGWWAGPESCAGMGTIASNPQDLLQSLSEPGIVRCDEAPLRVLGLSLAGYSALLSAALALLAARNAMVGRRGI